MAIRIQLRRDTALNWSTANPVLVDGEPGYDSTNDRIRVGNGVDTWSELPEFALAPLVLGPTDPIPVGTPSGTVIYRTE